MISITSPISDSLLYNTDIFVEYEVKENSKSTDKVVFYVDAVKFEKIELKGRFQVTGLAEGKHTIRAYLVNKFNKKIVGSEVKYFFYTNTDVLEIKNKVSSIIPTQIPDFIRQDYEQFVSFIEAYYKFLEQSNDPKLVPLSSKEFSDVDLSPTIFNEKFRKQFIPDFPSELTYDVETGKPLNLKTLIKRASEFYRSKGTQHSFNFMFRVLFDEDIEFYYPREHMFVVSGGLWVEKKTLKIFSTNASNERLMVGSVIYQLNDENIQVASARVVSCNIFKQSPFTVAELELTEVLGEFIDGYPILCDVLIEDSEETLNYNLKRGVVQIDIVSSGYNYKIGERVYLVSLPNAQGVGYTGKVSKVGSRGEVQEITTVNFGVNYEENLQSKYTVSIVSTNGLGFSGTATSGVVFDYSGYYASSNGVLGDRSFIQDNDYYQTHSYEIISNVPFQSYYDTIKRTVHPAGYKMFGAQLLSTKMALEVLAENLETNITASSSYYIGNYIAYRIDGDVNLRDITLDGNDNVDLFPSGPNMTQPIPPDSDGYFIHNNLGNPETTNIDSAYFENFGDLSSYMHDWDQRTHYWVVFPHPSVLINNTNGSIENFFDLQIQDVAVVGETTH
jgi:hypothetical protein